LDIEKLSQLHLIGKILIFFNDVIFLQGSVNMVECVKINAQRLDETILDLEYFCATSQVPVLEQSRPVNQFHPHPLIFPGPKPSLESEKNFTSANNTSLYPQPATNTQSLPYCPSLVTHFIFHHPMQSF